MPSRDRSKAASSGQKTATSPPIPNSDPTTVRASIAVPNSTAVPMMFNTSTEAKITATWPLSRYCEPW